MTAKELREAYEQWRLAWVAVHGELSPEEAEPVWSYQGFLVSVMELTEGNAQTTHR